MDTNGPNRNSVFKKVATPWNDDSVNDVKLHYARTQGEVNAGNEFYRGNLPAATSSAERMFLSREYESRCGICREAGLVPARRHSLRVKLGGTRDGETRSLPPRSRWSTDNGGRRGKILSCASYIEGASLRASPVFANCWTMLHCSSRYDWLERIVQADSNILNLVAIQVDWRNWRGLDFEFFLFLAPFSFLSLSINRKKIKETKKGQIWANASMRGHELIQQTIIAVGKAVKGMTEEQLREEREGRTSGRRGEGTRLIIVYDYVLDFRGQAPSSMLPRFPLWCSFHAAPLFIEAYYFIATRLWMHSAHAAV